MALTQILDRIKNAPLALKLIIIIAVMLIIGVTVSYYFYTEAQDAKIETKINKIENESGKSTVKVASKTKELRNDVIEHGKSVKKTTDQINKIVKKNSTFKPMQHETIKVKDASYDAMRSVLDDAQPNP